MNHSFDIDIAKQYGVNCAIIFEYLHFWIEKNKANEKNCFEGTYWTYNSVKAFKELFPYMSSRQISTALQRLEDEGLIQTGNFNEVAYDRTKWYAITQKGNSILQKCKMDYAEMSNGFDKSEQPIPFNKPFNKPFTNTVNSETNSNRFVKPTVQEIQDYINQKGYNIDAQYFFDYYEASNWYRGKTKVKNWKAVLSTWNRKEVNSVRGNNRKHHCDEYAEFD